MKLEDIKARIEENIAAEKVEITDLGGGDHIHALVVSKDFAGLPLLKQHKLILDLFQAEIASNDVHALSVKTVVPE